MTEMQAIKKKVFIAVLSYDGKVDVGCCASILGNIRAIEKEGYEVVLHFECGNCYVPQARSACVARFLETDADDMIFVDADLSFGSDAMLKLLSSKEDVVCGAYPFRAGTEGYPIRVMCNPDGTPVTNAAGLIEIEGGPTGFMKINRMVLNTLISQHPEWATNSKSPLGRTVYAVFDTGLLRNDGQWWGEDYLFCLRWRDMGGRIWCEPRITFEHIGRTARSGNYHKFLMAQPKPEAVNV